MRNQPVMDFGERLKAAIKSTGLSVNGFANACDIAEGSFRSYFSGTIPSADKALRIAQAAKVSLEWLISGNGEMRPLAAAQMPSSQMISSASQANAILQAQLLPSASEQFQVLQNEITTERMRDAALNYKNESDDFSDKPDLLPIPQLSIESSAGVGAVNEKEMTIGWHAFDRNYLRSIGGNPGTCYIISVRGDSMQPTLDHGDLIMVDRAQRRIKGDGIYIVVVGEAVFVKRVQIRMNGSMILRSDNPAYPPEEIALDDATALKIAGRVLWFGRAM